MNILKKTISVFLMILLLAGVFTSCGSSDKKQSDKSLQIVTTVFPAYDWTKEILGDRAEDAELTMLLDDGVDVHSYQPTAEDLEKIASCDLFIYVGGESDEWVEDALKSKTNKNRVEINLMDALGDSVKEEEEVEGMQSAFAAALPAEAAARCDIGSIKSNLGHMESAAGLAGVLKVIVAMERRRLPASLHVSTLNSRMSLQGSPLQVLSTARAWDAPSPRIAGVSSFGSGGANGA